MFLTRYFLFSGDVCGLHTRCRGIQQQVEYFPGNSGGRVTVTLGKIFFLCMVTKSCCWLGDQRAWLFIEFPRCRSLWSVTTGFCSSHSLSSRWISSKTSSRRRNWQTSRWVSTVYQSKHLNNKYVENLVTFLSNGMLLLLIPFSRNWVN